MDWSSEHRRGPTALGLSSIVALWFGCFDGAGALGYPCATDDDCGPSLTCASTGCCGGACLFGPDSTGDSTTTAATTEATTSSTTIEPSTTEGSESSSSTGLPEPVCGNGVMEEGEECDDGEARNDYWGPCSPHCVRTILHFTDAEQGNEDFCVGKPQCSPSWHRTNGQNGAWGSGIYETTPSINTLVSKMFVVPGIEASGGLIGQLEIRHAYRFNVCDTGSGPEYYDGARVLLERVDDMTRVQVLPHIDDVPTGPAACGGTPKVNAPWCNSGPPPERIYVGDSGVVVTSRRVAIPEDMLDVPVRLLFEVAYDTNNCMGGGGEPDAWLLERVIVTLDETTP